MSEKNTAIELAKNKRRVFDQIATMHFSLSDKYRRWVKVEDAIEIILSVVLCGITFFDFEKFCSISERASTLVTGLSSILLFAFTLLKQSWDHKQMCEKYQLAGKLYSSAKLELTAKLTEWEVCSQSENEIIAYLKDHYSSLNDLPQIPEKDFARLKHKHQYKIEFSKFLDEHKSDSWFFCLIKFHLRNRKGREITQKCVYQYSLERVE